MAKLLFVCAALCLVAGALSDGCGPLQKLMVKTQWTEAYGTGHHRIEFGQRLWRTIFQKAPEAKKLFDRVKGGDINSPEFKGHIVRVYGGLDRLIAISDDADTLKADLDHLAAQHKDMKIPANYFDVFREAMLQEVFNSIGSKFNHYAWDQCLSEIAKAIQASLT